MMLAEQVNPEKQKALDQFLVDIELRAFRMAQLAVRNEQDALDIVQDAMFALVRRYAGKSENEWRPLFYKILENRIMDHHRQETTRRKWFFWRSANDEQEDAGIDMEDFAGDPSLVMDQLEMGGQLLEILHGLPVQQQQCFLLRCWEGLSVRETADAMGINEGSVKTHYFRAMKKMQEAMSGIDDC